ncbi:MAG: hypothetical protein ABF868_03135 [Sporolactobacillus sp.]
MIKSKMLLAAIVFMLILTGCAATSSNTNSIPKAKRTPAEQVAAQFAEAYYSGNHTRAQNAIDQSCNSKEKQKLFRRIDSEKKAAIFPVIRVITEFQKSKNAQTDVLIRVSKTPQKRGKRKIIAIRNDKVVGLWTSKDHAFKKIDRLIKKQSKESSD